MREDRTRLNIYLYQLSFKKGYSWIRTFIVNNRHIFPFSFLFWKGKCAVTRCDKITRKKCYCKCI